MKKIIFPFLIVAAFILFVGCFNDKADLVNPNTKLLGCDTTGISYSATITPIFTNNHCNDCHSGSASSGQGIQLDSYDKLVAYIKQNPTYLLRDLNESSAPYHMPSGYGKISDCEINKVAAWINQGFKK